MKKTEYQLTSPTRSAQQGQPDIDLPPSLSLTLHSPMRLSFCSHGRAALCSAAACWNMVSWKFGHGVFLNFLATTLVNLMLLWFNHLSAETDMEARVGEDGRSPLQYDAVPLITSRSQARMDQPLSLPPC